MEKSILLARSNLQKAKGQAAGIVVLILLAALMLNLWLMLSFDYKKNFDRCHERLQDGHVTIAVDGEPTEMKEFLEPLLRRDARTTAYSVDASMHMVGLFEYNGGEINSEFIFLEKETALSRTVGRVEIVEDSDFTSGIYMPVLYRSEEVAVGRTIEISIGSHPMTFTVCGFFNSPMAGSHNCSMCELILTTDQYEKLKETDYAPEAALCSVRLQDKEQSEDYEVMLKNEVSFQYPNTRMASNSYALVSQSRYISQMICAGIMSATAFFVLLIALVVIVSNIINDIQENIKNLGALKAVGYTGCQLVNALLLQFLGLTLAAAVVGAGLSYLLFPYVNEMMVSQTGIPYEVRFLPAPLLLTIAVLSGAVAVAVRLAARRIHRIEPIVALRQGVATHNFRRNHVPLAENQAPLTLLLALKTTCSGLKQNLTVGITMLVLSLVIVFSGLMKENIITDMTPFLAMIVGETADSCINVNAAAEEALLEKIHADKRVEKAYLYHSAEVRHIGGVCLLATMCDDFSQVNNQGVIIEGRYPCFENEIALAAKYAEEQGLKIGDEITLTADGREAAYLIAGLTQISNNLGKDCLLTRKGYERLGELANTSYYLNLTEDTDIEAFHQEIKESLADEVNMTINILSTIEGSSSVYVSLMTAIVAAVLALSGIVAAFVLYLLVRALLNRKKRDYGILKALGFTTRQLVLQTALSLKIRRIAPRALLAGE